MRSGLVPNTFDDMVFNLFKLLFIGYSIIGTPCVYKSSKMLKNNLTCIATTSTEKIEFIQFIDGSCSKNEIFEAYLSSLVKTMKEKYSDKKLVFVMDNLFAHKSSLIGYIIQDKQASILYTPSSSPQFSPIENVFSRIK